MTFPLPNRVAKSFTAILLLLAFGGFAIAQTPNRKLVMGSVYRVVRNLLEVKEEGGDLAVIKVDAATKYVDSTTHSPAKLKDIAVGDQIVIKVIVKDGVEIYCGGGEICLCPGQEVDFDPLVPGVRNMFFVERKVRRNRCERDFKH